MVDEPLLESAPIAWRLARELCRTNPATGASCEWLHAFWQCLRIIGLAATPDRHAGFYQAAFDGVGAGDGSPRILVSGTADYSMLAHVLAAFRARGVEPSVTVIDVCETPLELNRWYAQRAGGRVETAQSSVLQYPAPAPFDCVCTHSFLGMFSGEERPALIAAWRRLLKPGGRVVITHPLQPLQSNEPNRFSPEQATAFRGLVGSRAAQLAAIIGTEPDAIMARAERYLEARYGHPLRSGDEIAALFEDGGFDPVHIACGPVTVEEPPAIGGPGLRKPNAHYASVVAIRA